MAHTGLLDALASQIRTPPKASLAGSSVTPEALAFALALLGEEAQASLPERRSAGSAGGMMARFDMSVLIGPHDRQDAGRHRGVGGIR